MLLTRSEPKTLKPLTILVAFKATGLYPYNPSMVLDKLRTKEKDVDKWMGCQRR